MYSQDRRSIGNATSSWMRCWVTNLFQIVSKMLQGRVADWPGDAVLVERLHQYPGHWPFGSSAGTRVAAKDICLPVGL